MTGVPAQYAGLLQQAANNSGIPYNVVAAQINLESGFNPRAVSPTGAEGLAQFEPSTWSSYGSGSPFDPQAAMAAYAKYMKTLLNEEHGNLQNALAAYNAGPGNLAAGMGYANQILHTAGVSSATTVADNTGATTASSGFSLLDPGSWFPSIFGSLIGSAEKPIADILERGALIVFGAILIIFGIIRFTSAGQRAQQFNQSKRKSSPSSKESSKSLSENDPLTPSEVSEEQALTEASTL